MQTRLLVKALFLFNCKLLCYSFLLLKLALSFCEKAISKVGNCIENKQKKTEYTFESEKRIRKNADFCLPIDLYFSTSMLDVQ